MNSISQTVRQFEKEVLAEIYRGEGIAVDDENMETLLAKLAVLNRRTGPGNSGLSALDRALLKQIANSTNLPQIEC